MAAARLTGTEIETSVLGFGCAGLFRVPTASERRRLLDVAFGAGIRHYDAAPMYGLGLVERELGRFARSRRDRLVIATKFGIAPTPAGRAVARVQAPLQRLLGAAPAVRERTRPAAGDARAGAVGAALYGSPGYDAKAARASLERSLRALQTDHVDLLFLHDPRPGDVRSDDVRGYLESARAAGLVRAWGVAGEPDPVLAAVRVLGARVPVLQVRDDIFLRSRRRLGLDGTQATILFASLARALPRILAHVRSDAAVRRRWSDAVGADCGRSDTIASLLLRDALRENEGGPILFSSIRRDHVESAATAAAANESTAPALDAFRARVADELGAP